MPLKVCEGVSTVTLDEKVDGFSLSTQSDYLHFNYQLVRALAKPSLIIY